MTLGLTLALALTLTGSRSRVAAPSTGPPPTPRWAGCCSSRASHPNPDPDPDPEPDPNPSPNPNPNQVGWLLPEPGFFSLLEALARRAVARAARADAILKARLREEGRALVTVRCPFRPVLRW